MEDKDHKMEKKDPLEFIVDILKWLLEINFHKYGEKRQSL